MLRTVALNPSSVSRLLVRATNWLGDAVMSLPATRAIRAAFPGAEISIAARASVADVYAREAAIDRILPCPAPSDGLRARREFAARLREERFDAAILLPNSFDSALTAWMAGIPERIGYRRDGRGWLLTRPIPIPEPGEIPRHERFYYLELLRRAGLIECFPESGAIRLDGIETARKAGAAKLRALGVAPPVAGISPGAAYGNAKRWLPERFAETAAALGDRGLSFVVFGASSERDVCESVTRGLAAAGLDVRNLAGETTLAEFIDLAAACRLFLTNDSGAMHVASAAGVPTLAVFGATDDVTTGPTGPLARVIREHAECSPCLLRDCPIDHRCMTRVSAARVAATTLDLWKESDPAWIPVPKS
jgi:heptosyltransferase-2